MYTIISVNWIKTNALPIRNYSIWFDIKYVPIKLLFEKYSQVCPMHKFNMSKLWRRREKERIALWRGKRVLRVEISDSRI
jgi:hypothetical protein